MIVRSAPPVWVLISQVEHARIAAEIAALWRLPDVLTRHAGDFQFAVRHHDDGWSAWESAPTVDSRGRPRNFMDMPMPVATHLWTTSVEIAARQSPWCGLWVSRHFCHLGELALHHRQTVSDCDSAQRFQEQQAALQQQWRQVTGVEVDGRSTIEIAGFHSLQFFDRMSLWLCCAERSQPQEFDDPSGEKTRWIPVSPTEIRVESAAFTVNELRLAAPVIVVPQRPYASDAELHDAMAAGQRGTLNWTLSNVRFVPSQE